MIKHSECHQIDIVTTSIVAELELTDFDADRQLLALPGISLVIFTSTGCAKCRWLRQQLPAWRLPVARVCWIDAGDSGGLVERYQVGRLPAVFVVRDSKFFGELGASFNRQQYCQALDLTLAGEAEELP